MNIACSTFTWDDLPIASALYELRQAGFDCAEIGAFEGWGHANASDAIRNADLLAAQISQAAARQQVRIIAANAGFGSDLNLDEECVRAEALFRVFSLVGVRHVTIQPGGMDAVSERLRRLLALAAKNDLALSVETHIKSATETIDGALSVLEAVPGLTLTLDPSHYLIQGLSLNALAPLIPHVTHIHLRDASAGQENIQVPCGQGDLDLGPFMALLDEGGYDGAYGVEIIRSENWQIPIADAPAEARKMGEKARLHLG